MNSTPSQSRCAEHDAVCRAIEHHKALPSDRPDLHAHFEREASATFNAGWTKLSAEVDRLREHTVPIYLRWAAPFFGTSDADRADLLDIFNRGEVGRLFQALSGHPATSGGNMAGYHELAGRFQQLA